MSLATLIPALFLGCPPSAKDTSEIPGSVEGGNDSYSGQCSGVGMSTIEEDAVEGGLEIDATLLTDDRALPAYTANFNSSTWETYKIRFDGIDEVLTDGDITEGLVGFALHNGLNCRGVAGNRADPMSGDMTEGEEFDTYKTSTIYVNGGCDNSARIMADALGGENLTVPIGEAHVRALVKCLAEENDIGVRTVAPAVIGGNDMRTIPVSPVSYVDSFVNVLRSARSYFGL
ncbi:MAG: hypothetical protein ACD_62C00182G0003 [uncultured bacterium]|nr:MAG: hypothetical protein ACD_62C00182G0003 [uncultured bacterium]HLD45496.1 hypothetical protein [bacterium]